MGARKKGLTCAMCDRVLPGGVGGMFDPPHKDARYCIGCYGRIWIIVSSRVEAALQNLVDSFTKKTGGE